jgi:hypothetical protein
MQRERERERTNEEKTNDMLEVSNCLVTGEHQRM